jgi:hypothetical protein
VPAARPCLVSGCDKPARLLARVRADVPEEQPAFCSKEHAATWAIRSVPRLMFWCERGHHWLYGGAPCVRLHGPLT